MNSLENAINSLDIDNRFEIVMGKILDMDDREKFSVPEASHKSSIKSSEPKKERERTVNLKK